MVPMVAWEMKRDWKWWEILALAVAQIVGLLIAFFLLGMVL